MRITDPSAFARLAIPHAARHGLSRRQLLKAGAATTAAVAASAMLARPALAARATGAGTPTPVPANPAFGGLHVYSVGPNSENSAITDFKGIVGAAIVDGTGIAKSSGGSSEKLLFDSDMRFMQGIFRGTDGVTREGTFAFV
jgi:TAT (twin-arginine translocation) pathway signal sequence